MAASARVALRPHNEASRPSAKGRLTNISDAVDSALALRLQRLSALGVSRNRAELLAGIAWREVSHG